jgi:hypothetical protein
MPERVLPLLAVALTAVGCSVLVNTDFSGGTEPAATNKGGQGGDTVVEMGGGPPGAGGVLGEGGANEGGAANAVGEGGAGNETSQGGSGGAGGTGMSGTGGDAGEAEGGNGADGGTGGSTGGLAGSAGTNATGGAGTGGGGMGGTAGTAETGGAGAGGSAGTTAGMSGAGGMTCDADLTSDPMHCGTCTTVCDAKAECIDSKCVSSPCDQLCPPSSMWTGPVDTSNGIQIQKFNSTADICVEVKSYDPPPPFVPTFNCWNTQTRFFEVNGARMTCDVGNKALVVPTRKGGYCVHASAGTADYAGFVMPNNGVQQ